MTRRAFTSPGALIAVAVAWFGLDQATKHWALGALDDRDIDLLGSLRFHLTFNSGMAFGKGGGLGPLIAMVALVVILVLVVSVPKHSPVGVVAAGMVVGGAVGNLCDRLLRAGDGFLGGRVVDFIDLQWWPVFNVADIGITVGGVTLVLVGLREPRHPRPSGVGPGDA